MQAFDTLFLFSSAHPASGASQVQAGARAGAEKSPEGSRPPPSQMPWLLTLPVLSPVALWVSEGLFPLVWGWLQGR